MRLLIVFLLFPFYVFAQHPISKPAPHKTVPKEEAPKPKQAVVVDKEGLVTVWGQPAFYLKSKSIVPWESDYAVENLQHEQLAYLKLAKGYHYMSNSNSHQEVQYYVLTFNNGAHAEVRDYMKNSKSIITALAIVLVNNGLIANNQINEPMVKEYVGTHNGSMTPAKPDTADVMSNSAIPHSDADSLNGVISMKDDFIYYDDKIIGTYKKVDIDKDLLSVQVYSINRNKVAEVTHDSEESNWRIVTVVDQKRDTLPYNKDTALPDLFRYLLKKRYL